MIAPILTDGLRLAITAKQYEPIMQVYQSDGTGPQIVAKRDPRRIYIEFRSHGGLSYPRVYPVKLPANHTAGELDSETRIYKFKDSPGIVTGEWYIDSTDALATMEIITDTYVGR